MEIDNSEIERVLPVFMPTSCSHCGAGENGKPFSCHVETKCGTTIETHTGPVVIDERVRLCDSCGGDLYDEKLFDENGRLIKAARDRQQTAPE